MAHMSCANCKFFYLPDHYGRGQCCRYPPHDGEDRPEVIGSDFCGEFVEGPRRTILPLYQTRVGFARFPFHYVDLEVEFHYDKSDVTEGKMALYARTDGDWIRIADLD